MSNLKKGVSIIKKGGIVIFPTDTAFGIGCRIDDEKAVKKLFDMRKRPQDKPAPVLIDSIEMAEEFSEKIPSDVLENLIKPFWPGALTIILNCNKKKVPCLVRGGGNTLGFRMPDNKLALGLIKGVGVPILGSSANFSNGKTPFKESDLDKKLIKLVDFVLPGATKEHKTSTVIDCSKKPWKVLRKGAVEIKLENKRKIILVIDTADTEPRVDLIINNKQYSLRRKFQKAQVLLPLINEILEKHNVSLKNINEIRVNTGPGSFTGLRVGISVANTLGRFLRIPVNSRKIGELEEPKYK